MQRRSYASTNTNTYNQAKNNTHAVNNNNTTQKHRLILDSLNVVPYEEYYEKNHHSHQQPNIQPRALPQSP